MKKWKVIFKYPKFGSSGYKYIYAKTKRDAMITFNEIYKSQIIEIKEIIEVENNENTN